MTTLVHRGPISLPGKALYWLKLLIGWGSLLAEALY